jgi:hypothetical protein
MKWYWAIPLTLALFGLTVFVAYFRGVASAKNAVRVIITLSAVWAAAKSSSVGWGLFVLFLWPIGFPYFLIARYKRPPDPV